MFCGHIGHTIYRGIPDLFILLEGKNVCVRLVSCSGQKLCGEKKPFTNSVFQGVGVMNPPHALRCVTVHTSGFTMLCRLWIPGASARRLVSTGADLLDFSVRLCLCYVCLFHVLFHDSYGLLWEEIALGHPSSLWWSQVYVEWLFSQVKTLPWQSAGTKAHRNYALPAYRASSPVGPDPLQAAISLSQWPRAV